jgi:hypothetical protein
MISLRAGPEHDVTAPAGCKSCRAASRPHRGCKRQKGSLSLACSRLAHPDRTSPLSDAIDPPAVSDRQLTQTAKRRVRLELRCFCPCWQHVSTLPTHARNSPDSRLFHSHCLVRHGGKTSRTRRCRLRKGGGVHDPPHGRIIRLYLTSHDTIGPPAILLDLACARLTPTNVVIQCAQTQRWRYHRRQDNVIFSERRYESSLGQVGDD